MVELFILGDCHEPIGITILSGSYEMDDYGWLWTIIKHMSFDPSSLFLPLYIYTIIYQKNICIYIYTPLYTIIILYIILYMEFTLYIYIPLYTINSHDVYLIAKGLVASKLYTFTVNVKSCLCDEILIYTYPILIYALRMTYWSFLLWKWCLYVYPIILYIYIHIYIYTALLSRRVESRWFQYASRQVTGTTARADLPGESCFGAA